jgi:hypothetical protein
MSYLPLFEKERQMDWTKWFTLIKTLIENCTNTDGAEVVVRRMKEGGPVVRFAVTRQLRQAGLRGGELRTAVDDVLDALDNASDEQIQGLVKSK